MPSPDPAALVRIERTPTGWLVIEPNGRDEFSCYRRAQRWHEYLTAWLSGRRDVALPEAA